MGLRPAVRIVRRGNRRLAHPSHRRRRLRRGGLLQPRRPDDPLRLQPRRLRHRTDRRAEDAAGTRPLVLHRPVPHGRGRLERGAADGHPRLRRRAVLLPGRRPHLLAAVRRGRGDRGDHDGRRRRHGRPAIDQDRGHVVGPVLPPVRGVPCLHDQRPRLRELRAVPRPRRRAGRTGPRHRDRRLRRAPRLPPGRRPPCVDQQPHGRQDLADLHRRLGPRGRPDGARPVRIEEAAARLGGRVPAGVRRADGPAADLRGDERPPHRHRGRTQGDRRGRGPVRQLRLGARRATGRRGRLLRPVRVHRRRLARRR